MQFSLLDREAPLIQSVSQATRLGEVAAQGNRIRERMRMCASFQRLRRDSLSLRRGLG